MMTFRFALPMSSTGISISQGQTNTGLGELRSSSVHSRTNSWGDLAPRPPLADLGFT